jgi:cell division protease FtsH
MAKMEKRTQVNVWYFVIAMFAILAVQHFWTQAQTVEQITYSEFQRDLEQGNIKDVAVSDRYIRGTYTAPKNGKTEFVTTRVEPGIADHLKKSGVSYKGVVESTFIRDLLSWVLPVLFFVGVWYFVIRRMAERSGGLGGFMSVGKSKAKVYMETDTKVTFEDVAGVDEAQAELVEIVEFLKDPAQYGKLGARIPKGILLVGPPGTGKTLLARAVAGEAGVPFFSINGSEFVEMFVGVGAARVRDLFEQARAKAPAIIFIDELDALGRARGAFPAMGGHDEREQTLNQLLSELDGFDPREGVVLLAATNRPEILDPALLRAGRFDRQVLVDRPDKEGRIQILKVHMRKITLAPDVDPAAIAALTTGFTGADLANLVNEAALFATRRRGQTVTLDDFTQAIERIIAGLEKRNRLLNPKERRIVAYHEMGHALVALALPGSDVVHKVSIIPRGIGSLGYTIQRPTDERYLMTREELENKIAVLLGGRAAEKVVFGELSTGAADDLAKVTDIARSMAARFGMDERLGYVAYDADRAGFLGQPAPLPYAERRFSEETAREIDTAVRETIGLAFDKAVRILTENREVLERAAKRLLAEETLDEAAINDQTKDLRRAKSPAEPSAALAG